MLGTLESSQARCFAHRSGPINKRPPAAAHHSVAARHRRSARLLWAIDLPNVLRPSAVTRARKQYRFHKEWWAVRQCAEFDRIAAFVAALPALRRRPKRYLA